jgi:hypothetical protein
LENNVVFQNSPPETNRTKSSRKASKNILTGKSKNLINKANLIYNTTVIQNRNTSGKELPYLNKQKNIIGNRLVSADPSPTITEVQLSAK